MIIYYRDLIQKLLYKSARGKASTKEFNRLGLLSRWYLNDPE